MTTLAIVFLLASSGALLFLPRCWAPLPLLMGACYVTLGQYFEIGAFRFTMIRVLVLVGFTRVVFRRERIAGGFNFIDAILFLWATWALTSSGFHEEVAEALTWRSGLVFNALGIYFLLRTLIQGPEDIHLLGEIVILVLIPVALEMASEQLTGRNAFSFLGGVSEEAIIRNGRIRAQGPFAHPIMAGTIGATSLTLAFYFWKRNNKLAIAGLLGSTTMVMSSMSSGPIMTVVFSLLALGLWKFRYHMVRLRWFAICLIFLLTLVMKAPVYYLIARVDLTGSSTGWHRAALIESAFKHINEWWLAGTDHTRHWMPTGVGWNDNHTDITNYYIKMGVLGGMPLVILFLGLLAAGFVGVNRIMTLQAGSEEKGGFLAWTLGAMLFGHCATFMSATYFDQSIFFLYLTLAAISSFYSTAVKMGTNSETFLEGIQDEEICYERNFDYHR